MSIDNKTLKLHIVNEFLQNGNYEPILTILKKDESKNINIYKQIILMIVKVETSISKLKTLFIAILNKELGEE